jgi:O-antigen ligase
MKQKFDLILFFQRLKEKTRFDIFFYFLLILICSIPLPNAINNVVIGVFIFYILLQIKKKAPVLKFDLILLVVFFLWMSISCFWSIDVMSSVLALPKESSLFLIPFCFAFVIFKNKGTIVKYYSISILFYVVFFLLRAIYLFFIDKNPSVFIDNQLVTKELNAVHFSVFVSLALFHFIIKPNKTKFDYFQTLLLSGFLVLLGSKIIISTDIILLFIYYFFYSKSANKMRLRNIALLVIVFFSFLFFNRIKEKIEFEFQLNKDNNIGHTVIPKEVVGDRIISMKEAWGNEKFEQNDFFSGASFRVYQFRIFLEILTEEQVFFEGLGLNASYKKIEEKGIKYNVFQGNNITEGYQKKNFHNQYIQVFAELGCIGFVLLVLILSINLKNAFKNKDFLHIAFAILMLSLFLTESFLWRQRGVVFFTVFYCLFNTTLLNNKE